LEAEKVLCPRASGYEYRRQPGDIFHLHGEVFGRDLNTHQDSLFRRSNCYRPKMHCPDFSCPKFHGAPIIGGNFIGFRANLTASGTSSTGANVFFQNSTIRVTAHPAYNLNVPKLSDYL
jgi:hypothetical protein